MIAAVRTHGPSRVIEMAETDQRARRPRALDAPVRREGRRRSGAREDSEPPTPWSRNQVRYQAALTPRQAGFLGGDRQPAGKRGQARLRFPGAFLPTRLEASTDDSAELVVWKAPRYRPQCWR